MPFLKQHVPLKTSAPVKNFEATASKHWSLYVNDREISPATQDRLHASHQHKRAMNSVFFETVAGSQVINSLTHYLINTR